MWMVDLMLASSAFLIKAACQWLAGDCSVHIVNEGHSRFVDRLTCAICSVSGSSLSTSFEKSLSAFGKAISAMTVRSGTRFRVVTGLQARDSDPITPV